MSSSSASSSIPSSISRDRDHLTDPTMEIKSADTKKRKLAGEDDPTRAPSSSSASPSVNTAKYLAIVDKKNENNNSVVTHMTSKVYINLMEAFGKEIESYSVKHSVPIPTNPVNNSYLTMKDVSDRQVLDISIFMNRVVSYCTSVVNLTSKDMSSLKEFVDLMQENIIKSQEFENASQEHVARICSEFWVSLTKIVKIKDQMASTSASMNF